jgi:hypothetical protein
VTHWEACWGNFGPPPTASRALRERTRGKLVTATTTCLPSHLWRQMLPIRESPGRVPSGSQLRGHHFDPRSDDDATNRRPGCHRPSFQRDSPPERFHQWRFHRPDPLVPSEGQNGDNRWNWWSSRRVPLLRGSNKPWWQLSADAPSTVD